MASKLINARYDWFVHPPTMSHCKLWKFYGRRRRRLHRVIDIKENDQLATII